jgi:glycosyltransferase involved in cell wall biosynthesis
MINISVVIPCFNVEAYIEEGLRTVLSQTVLPLEIICVDDGSKDKTIEIIRKLQIEFPNKIQLFINDGNRGATYSRNRGLAVANGEYIQFFDADDLLNTNKFEYQISLIENSKPKPDIIIGSLKKLFLDGSEKLYIYENSDPWVGLIDAMLGVTTSNLFRREKLIEVKGWTDDLKSSQEYDLMFRMLQKDAVVLVDNKIVSTNRERANGSITKTNPGEKWKRFITLRIRIFNFLSENGKLTNEIKQTFINIVFDACRILYYYDKKEAIKIYNENIKGVGTPQTSPSTSQRYLNIYKLLGFNFAQVVSSIFNSTQPRIH